MNIHIEAQCCLALTADRRLLNWLRHSHNLAENQKIQKSRLRELKQRSYTKHTIKVKSPGTQALTRLYKHFLLMHPAIHSPETLFSKPWIVCYCHHYLISPKALHLSLFVSSTNMCLPLSFSFHKACH